MRKIRKCVAVLLSAIMMTTMVSFNAMAQDQNTSATETMKRTNLEIITDTDGKLEYTYMEGGKQYKAVEYTENHEVESYIYVMNSSGEFVLQSHFNTYFEYTEEGFVVRKIENGEETVEVLFENISEPSQIVTRSTPPPPPSSGYGWQKVCTVQGSTKLYNDTLAATKEILASLATELANRTYNVGIILGTYVLTELATRYFANGLDYAYMKQVSYYYYPTGQIVPTQARIYTYGYSNSNYTNLVGGPYISTHTIRLGGN